MENFNDTDIRYLEAKKRVKRIKGFYIHAFIYVVVNIGLILINVDYGKRSLDNIDLYWTPIFWGVGLLGHGLSVFLPNFILGKNWEEEKIRELMNKNK
ncbi:2TM domain-containing protein [Kaistella polysaccharea]|uniref:2TM domain-containing protein n=1 Tax=Kaistella polysaccharea TaxID=2878534 RepID=UPI001CF45F95|nr:2TM domain-containing protein [Kaistella polysaccharea]